MHFKNTFKNVTKFNKNIFERQLFKQMHVDTPDIKDSDLLVQYFTLFVGKIALMANV